MRELKKEQTLVSKNLSTETKDTTRVGTMIALNSFLQMVADTEPERVEKAKMQAGKWLQATQVDSTTIVGSVLAKEKQVERKRKVLDCTDDDPYNLPPAEILVKIAEQKQIEEDAKNRRETLEWVLCHGAKKYRKDLDNIEQ